MRAGAHDPPAVWTTEDGDDIAFFGKGAHLETLGGGAHLGVQVHGLDEELGRYFGTGEGVLILGVNEDTAAAEAGLQTGDVITSIDGQMVDSTFGMHEVLADFEAGDEVEVAYLRDKKAQTVKVELGESAGVFMVREFAGPRGMNEFHIQRAPRAHQYRMQIDNPEDLQQELQKLKEHLERLEKELERAGEGD
jgi:membrane-associated protease RseP (regulator of RpoE activity)